MHTINLWHQHHLCGIKAIGLSLAFFLLVSGTAIAQNRMATIGNNQTEYDKKLLHYGFYIAPKVTWLKHTPSQSFQPFAPNALVKSIKSEPKPGLSVGFVINLAVEQYLDLRFLPGVTIDERILNYTFANDTLGKLFPEGDEILGNTTYIDLPFVLKYKSKRRGNMRVYMLGGIKPSIEVGSNLKERDPSQFRIKGSDVTFEAGLGLDLYYPLVKFSPELRFSKGISDLKNPGDRNVYMNSVKRISSQTVSLILYFE